MIVSFNIQFDAETLGWSALDEDEKKKVLLNEFDKYCSGYIIKILDKRLKDKKDDTK